MYAFTKILSGTAILIGMYLILTKSNQTVSIINSIGGVYTNGVKMLQGRWFLWITEVL